MQILKRELLSVEDYDLLPRDDEEAFIFIAEKCKYRSEVWLNSIEAEGQQASIRMKMMSTVRVAAETYGVVDKDYFDIPDRINLSEEIYEDFLIKLDGLIVKLRIRAKRNGYPDRMEVGGKTKSALRDAITNLRDRVTSSNFPNSKLNSILAKIKEIEREIDRERFDLQKTVSLLSGIAIFLNQSQAAIVRVPETISTVIEIVRMVKEADAVQNLISSDNRPLIEDMRESRDPE